MSENDTTDSPAALPPPAEPFPARRGIGAVGWLLLIAAVAAGGYGYWRLHGIERERETAARTELSTAQSLRDETDALRRGAEVSQREAEALRARLDDTAKVNESLRGQVLGLTERVRLAEETLARLAEKRLSGRDALALDEAESLLVLARERYALFADPAPALAAYRLADETLAHADDAAFASVRQSLQAEIAALGALETADPAASQATLAHLRESLAALPVARREDEALGANSDSRLARVFARFVRIRRDEDANGRFGADDPLLARALLDASLREAQAALLIRDADRWRQSLDLARAQLAHDFDPAADRVAQARATLDALAKTVVAPPAPNVLGAALRELRALRAARAAPSAPPPPAAPAQGQT